MYQISWQFWMSGEKKWACAGKKWRILVGIIKWARTFFFFFLRTREIRKKIPDWHNCREVGTLYTTEESTNLGWPFWWLV